MKTIPFLEDLLFVSEILFCPRGIINKPTVGGSMALVKKITRGFLVLYSFYCIIVIWIALI
jgi:hypothetical protein